ncbi:MAG: hypothetical protein EBZ58_09560 [Bacteroidetes bacterium]|jgi:hypothetical protein|nr:hypothetical protein [Bacteroidota bacterium]
MKITKSRLLQIIKEEVELHEKKIEENTFELDEETVSLMKQLGKKTDNNKQDLNAVDDGDAFDNQDVNGDGQLDKKEMERALNDAIKVTVGRKKAPVAKEDRLFTKEKPHHIVEPNIK